MHFSYGMVELPEGKMKSREGTVVDADDLMDEMIEGAREVSAERGKGDFTTEEAAEIARIVGLGALKYFLLEIYPPVRSVLRKAADAGYKPEGYDTVVPNDKEISLIQHLADYPSVVAEAGRSYSPALIANYVYDLVKEYNQFYHDYSILNETDDAVRSMRLALSAEVAEVVKSGMGLLGIEVPERM